MWSDLHEGRPGPLMLCCAGLACTAMSEQQSCVLNGGSTAQPDCPPFAFGFAMQLLTVVDAATASMVGQAFMLSATGSVVSVSVALDAPPYLPATVAMQLSDPSVADVTPSVLTWRPGEAGDKQFVLSFKKLPAKKGLQATLQPINNVLASGAWGTAMIQPPMPRFKFVSNQVNKCSPRAGRLLRSVLTGWRGARPMCVLPHSVHGCMGGACRRAAAACDCIPTARLPSPLQAVYASTNSSTSNSTRSKVTTVTVPVRRVDASPFPSVVAYRAVLLDATGAPLNGGSLDKLPCGALCGSTAVFVDVMGVHAVRPAGRPALVADRRRGACPWDLLAVDCAFASNDPLCVCVRAGCRSTLRCAAAVAGNGTLYFASGADAANASVRISWDGLPGTALLHVGVALDGIINALELQQPNATAVFVFGTALGTCPAGARGAAGVQPSAHRATAGSRTTARSVHSATSAPCTPAPPPGLRAAGAGEVQACMWTHQKTPEIWHAGAKACRIAACTDTASPCTPPPPHATAGIALAAHDRDDGAMAAGERDQLVASQLASQLDDAAAVPSGPAQVHPQHLCEQRRLPARLLQQ